MHKHIEKMILDVPAQKIFDLAIRIEDFSNYIPNYTARLISIVSGFRLLEIETKNINISNTMIIFSKAYPLEKKIINHQIQGTQLKTNIAEWIFEEKGKRQTLVTAKVWYEISDSFFKKWFYEWVIVPRWIRAGFHRNFTCLGKQAGKDQI